MKNEFDTKKVAFTGLGALAFLLLFVFVKIPLNALNTNIQLAYAISGFAAAAYGPLSGFLVAFIGHTLNDFICYSSPWWSWIIASGLSGFVSGLNYRYIGPYLVRGRCGKRQISHYLLGSLAAHFLAWVICAPALDVLIYKETAAVVIKQGIIAFIVDFPTAFIGGLFLLKLYAALHKKNRERK